VRYREQQQFINRSRAWGAVFAVLVVATAGVVWKLWVLPISVVIAFWLTTVAVAFSIYYTPNYLHLTVNEDKRKHWEIKIRWRVIAAVVLLTLPTISGLGEALWLLGAAAWLAAANLIAPKVPREFCSFFFWSTDFLLLAGLLLLGNLGVEVGALLLAAAAHLALVISEQHPLRPAITIAGMGCLLLLLSCLQQGVVARRSLLALLALFLVVVAATSLPVARAQRHNARNVAAATRELQDFTGYSSERIRTLWSTSNQELAKNWEAAAPDPTRADCLAEWYRENSRLYMFAISAYNLEYKRIRSNLKVLRFAKGATLDYGAGNGEILLELARHGQRATYYDVEGDSMKFAQHRAEAEGLEIEFCHSKDALRASASRDGFDTVFAFDVLEHLPDLPGELTFLSSLLNQGGLFLFDVPAGSTRSHPMHLNHELNVRAHMLALGLRQERNLLQKLSFRKEEKFFFRAVKAAG
jgi:SAM-dependent methyltransferase